MHLWLTFPHEIDNAKLLARYLDILSEEEKAQQQRFLFEKDRHRYLVTRTLVRTVLSRYADTRPEEWGFRSNAYGRPEIDRPQALRDALVFNVSHTDGLIVCAVTRQRLMGVDVESMERRATGLEQLASRFFSPQECAALNRVPAADRHGHFFHYWTLKEAYIKARGMGLSIPLDKFTFSMVGDGALGLSIAPELADSADRWLCWLYKPTPCHLLAVCAERIATPGQEPAATKIVPLVSEEPFPLSLLRRSPMPAPG